MWHTTMLPGVTEGVNSEMNWNVIEEERKGHRKECSGNTGVKHTDLVKTQFRSKVCHRRRETYGFIAEADRAYKCFSFIECIF